jgi:thiol:disulfide interchange protein DsbD
MYACKNKLFILFILLGVFTSNLHANLPDNTYFEEKAEDVEFLQANEAFDFDSVEADGNLNVRINIAKGYYLYKNKVKVIDEHKSLIQAPLPKGSLHTDEYFGEQQVYRHKLEFSLPTLDSKATKTIVITYQGCAEAGLCYSPQKKVIQLTSGPKRPELIVQDNNAGNTEPLKESSTTSSDSLSDILASDNLLWVLMMFFLLGLGLSFTPCVFPMYPILTGIIVGQGEALSLKRAFLLSFVYVQGMAFTYTILGIVVAFAGMQFQAAFQHPIVLISLSILFIGLALSMFGIFNLALPSSLQEKLNSISNTQKGGSYFGVAVMGVLSGLVASPCTTAPLTAALLYIAQTGDVTLGASALYFLSIGMGVPLIILGSTGGKLLPKAGAWMNIIKNIFGFLLLAVPILLLQRIISEFLGDILWVLLALGFSGYLYVNNINAKTGFWFGVRSILIFLFMFISAKQAIEIVLPTTHKQIEANQHHFTKIASLNELQEKIKDATKLNKPVIVDLYADWCIACREFEKYTFYEPEVQAELSNVVMLQIDLTDSSSDKSIAFMKYYQVLGLPTILLFDQTGSELKEARVTGFLQAKPFAEHLNKYLN